jgi:hypothetical protein
MRSNVSVEAPAAGITKPGEAASEGAAVVEQPMLTTEITMHIEISTTCTSWIDPERH